MKKSPKKERNFHPVKAFKELLKVRLEKKAELRGYRIDAYVVLRYIWSFYWTAFVTGFLVYSVPGSLIPMLGIWYGNALGLASMEDTVTIAALYFVPYIFTTVLILIGCVAFIKGVAGYFRRRNDFLIRIHFEQKNAE